MRALLFILGWLCVGSSWAALSSAAVSGLTKTASGYTFKAPTATAANGAYNMSANVTSAGKQISMPASASLAANAASFALTAVRLNPAGLMVGLTAQWLIVQGLNYANDQWTKTGTAVPLTPYFYIGNQAAYAALGVAGIPAKVCAFIPVVRPGWTVSECTATAGTCLDSMAPGSGCQPGGTYRLQGSPNTFFISGESWFQARVNPGACPAGTTLQNGSCVPVPVPATEADFAAVASQPMTDGAASELGKVLDMPVNAPVLAPNPVDSYSPPYLDAVSGRQVKELTRVTPEPTAANPLNVRVERYQVDAGVVPGQTAQPAAATTPANSSNQPAAEATPDLCAANPGILACQQGAPGTAAATTNLYTADATGKTFANSINAFKASIAGSGVVAAAGGFFNAGNITGACTGLDTTFSLLGQSFAVELSPHFCGPNADVLYGYLAIGMLLLATAAAFAIAIL